MTEWERKCVLCGFGLESGHCCNRCRRLLREQLVTIERLVHEAAAQIEPARRADSGGSHAYGSKPPINLAAVDAELTMLEMNAGDPTSVEPILVMLESWERSVREDRAMAPYGPVSASGRAGASNDTKVTLAGVVGFLSAHTDWMCDTADFALEEYADHLKRAVHKLRHWDPENDERGMRVPCPADTDTGPCGYALIIRGLNDVTCRRCHSDWNVYRLVACVDPHEVWASPATLADVLNVSTTMLHQWASRRHIDRSAKGHYNLGQVQDRIATRRQRNSASA